MYSDPKTKEDFVNRLLSYDFNGDFTDLGEEPATVTRVSPYRFAVKFKATGQNYEIVVRKPRRAKGKLRLSLKPNRPAIARRPRAARA